MTDAFAPAGGAIAAVLADADGTLVNRAKVVTPRAIEAIERLHEIGNASQDVQRSATYVTASNEDGGFAKAIEEFILPRAVAAPVIPAAEQQIAAASQPPSIG